MARPVETSLAQLGDRLGASPAQMARLTAASEVLEAAPASARARALRVALRVADLQLGEDVVLATLLWPAVEVDAREPASLAEPFGAEPAKLVEGLGRLATIHWRELSAESNENLRRMFVAMAADVRVVIVTLADRIERLASERGSADAEDRRTLARETMDVFAPLANRLGIFQLKWELEDLAFRELEPETYRTLGAQLAQTRAQRQAYVEDIVIALRKMLSEHGIKGVVYGRPKHLYSIYKKMQWKALDLERVYDATAVRVIVDDIGQCYAVLGLVHGAWTPIPGEFDDYIARPKANGYQSLHSAVIGPNGRSVEIQIRTQQMHRWAEYGVAAHWAYKEATAAPVGSVAHPRKDATVEARFDLIRELMEWQREIVDPQALAATLQSDIFRDRVYVFTPGGDVLDLPTGATPLDFAYRVHTQVGHRCRGALVNDKMVALDRPLHTGDRVEILTKKHPEPSRDWLNPHLGYLATAAARQKVRQWFRELDRGKAIEAGRELLEREVARLAPLSRPEIEAAVRRLGHDDLDEVHAAIGFSEMGGQHLASRIVDLLLPDRASATPAELADAPTQTGPARATGVRVGAADNVLSTPAGCCLPVPGDDVVGFVSRGRGIIIHRRDCANLEGLESERIMDIAWGQDRRQRYDTRLQVRIADRPGGLRDVLGVLTELGIDVRRSLSTTDDRDQTALIDLRVDVPSRDVLVHALDRIDRLPVVIESRRVDG